MPWKHRASVGGGGLATLATRGAQPCPSVFSGPEPTVVAEHVRRSLLHSRALQLWAPWSRRLWSHGPCLVQLGTLFGTAPALTCAHSPFQHSALPILHTLRLPGRRSSEEPVSGVMNQSPRS